MKKVLTILLVLTLSISLCGCCLKPEWADATCTEPSTCVKCGKTAGEALGHQWVDATCTEPKTCSVCGETEGELAGHVWKKNETGKFQTCTVCGITEDIVYSGKKCAVSLLLDIELLKAAGNIDNYNVSVPSFEDIKYSFGKGWITHGTAKSFDFTILLTTESEKDIESALKSATLTILPNSTANDKDLAVFSGLFMCLVQATDEKASILSAADILTELVSDSNAHTKNGVTTYTMTKNGVEWSFSEVFGIYVLTGTIKN